MIESFHPPVKNMYILEVWFNNGFIIDLLKMWPNLLDQKYTYSNLISLGDFIEIFGLLTSNESFW